MTFIRTSTATNRLASSSQRQGDCLLWTGCVDRWGHGVVKHDGAKVRVQRLAWSEANGPLPPETTIRQTCTEPRCFEPAHLVADRAFHQPVVKMSARLPAPLVEEGRSRATRAGMTFTDVLTAALASWLARP